MAWKNYTIDLDDLIKFKIYFMKSEWSAIKEKMSCILSISSLFTAK